jgi:dTDP-4-dehydrorhamnose reductase
MILARASRGERIVVVDDVVMSPTYARDVSVSLRSLLENSAPIGVYHLANGGECSWHTFAKAIVEKAGLIAEVEATRVDIFAPRPRRPRFSALASNRLAVAGVAPMRSWGDALAAYLVERAAN